MVRMTVYKQISVFFVFIFCFLNPISIFASNLSFLDNSAITYFTEEDKTLMMANIINSLNGAKDGVKSVWKNPRSGAWGYAIPMKTRTIKGATCRTVKTYNNAKGVAGESIYTLCKSGKQWRFVKRKTHYVSTATN